MFKGARKDRPFIDSDSTHDLCTRFAPDSPGGGFCEHVVPIRQTRLSFTLEAAECDEGAANAGTGGGLSSSDVETWIAAQFCDTAAGKLAAARLGTDSTTASAAAAAAVRRFFSLHTEEQVQTLLRGVLSLVLEATVVAAFKSPKSYLDIRPATSVLIPPTSKSHASTLQLQFIVSAL